MEKGAVNVAEEWIGGLQEPNGLKTPASGWPPQVPREQGQQQGRDQGRAEERADALLTVLRARGIPVPDTERARILAEQDPERLKRWLERAAVAASLAEVLDEPS